MPWGVHYQAYDTIFLLGQLLVLQSMQHWEVLYPDSIHVMYFQLSPCFSLQRQMEQIQHEGVLLEVEEVMHHHVVSAVMASQFRNVLERHLEVRAEAHDDEHLVNELLPVCAGENGRMVLMPFFLLQKYYSIFIEPMQLVWVKCLDETIMIYRIFDDCV